jgi:hypothetical protein
LTAGVRSDLDTHESSVAAIDSGLDANSIANELARLQTLAAAFSRPPPAVQSMIALQVVFVIGAACPAVR